MTNPQALEQTSENQRFSSKRMSRPASSATEPGSSGFVLDSPTEVSRSKRGAKFTQSPDGSPASSKTKLARESSVAKELGESIKPRKVRKFAWAYRQLLRGACIARHGFALEEHPKRLYYQLETDRALEVLMLFKEHDIVTFAGFSWADVNGSDWYVVNQLELTR